MPKINILDKHTAELIAAGEVVERPASVVKELVENSIDAGASSVTVEIKDGGNTYIRVSDNGCGIEKDDIRKAFLRHATSKIQTEEDLSCISTLGFRGEALASIGAVAKVQMLTRTEKNEFGYICTVTGGEETEFDEVGCAEGTTIIVSDLFYNTPARRKFLKKNQTEANVILSLIERLAVSHPEISFKLIKESKTVLMTPGDTQLFSAISSVFGREFASSLIAVDYELNGIRVNGYVTNSEAARKSRSMQHFFLNGRYIRSKTAVAAIEQAYKNEIMTGKYPACVLFISIDFSQVDVNVHPSKMEVRFTDEHSVFSAVYYGVKSSFSPNASKTFIEPQPQNRQPEPPVTSVLPDFSNISFKRKEGNDFFRTGTLKFSEPDIFVTAKNDEIKTGEADAEVTVNPQTSINTDAADENDFIDDTRLEFKYIGEAFKTYIIVQTEKTLVLIDKHAAHERILFEKLKNNKQAEPQMLLAPVQVVLAADEYESVVSNIDSINQSGFELEDFGMKTVLVRAVPMELDSQEVSELISEIAGKLCERKTDFTPDFAEWLYHSVACRAAVKAGDKSSQNELYALADEVLNNSAIRHCPHGRPVAVELSENEVKRRFYRL